MLTLDNDYLNLKGSKRDSDTKSKLRRALQQYIGEKNCMRRTCIWIGRVKVSNQRNEKDNCQWYGDQSETPHCKPVPSCQAYHGVESCSDK
jgi:hypothetical protein